MKKLLMILISILAAVFAVLSLVSRDAEYNAERLYYRALRVNQKITANPDVVPPAMLATVEKNLKAVISKYSATDTARSAHMTLAEFYISREKYDNALSTLNTILSKEQDAQALSRASFLKGFVYEKQDRWTQALREYTALRDKYKETALGLQVPLYIGSHYKKAGDEAGADTAYREAAAFYEKIAAENKSKILGYAASNLLKQAYLELKQYGQAGSVVERILEDYQSDVAYAQQLPFVDLIYVKELKRPEKAVEIYTKVRAATKNEKIKEVLDKAIGDIKKDPAKNQ